MPPGVTTSFDPLAHHRERTRKAEARALKLEQLNAQLLRLLTAILQDWFRDTDVDPLEYLQAHVDIDESLTALSYSFFTCPPGRRDFDTLGLPRRATSSDLPATISDVEVPDSRRSR